MYYSYAMGMNEEIYELEKEGFIIEKDDNDFMITFIRIWQINGKILFINT